MIRPDLRPICENMLMAEGFVKARALAVKFVTLYSLSSELLSKQVHALQKYEAFTARPINSNTSYEAVVPLSPHW